MLRTLAFVEKRLTTRDGRRFTVGLMPYRTMENRIDNVVMTLTQITAAKKLEARTASLPPQTEGDLRRLQHELEVHQIELEPGRRRRERAGRW